MKIHEYQAKTLLKAAGVPVPEGIVCKSADDVAAAFEIAPRVILAIICIPLFRAHGKHIPDVLFPCGLTCERQDTKS